MQETEIKRIFLLLENNIFDSFSSEVSFEEHDSPKSSRKTIIFKMFNFPYLKSFVVKNDHCRRLFTRTVHWEKNISLLERNGEKQGERIEDMKKVDTPSSHLGLEVDSGGEDSEQKEKGAVHWKKAVKLKFEGENEEQEAASQPEFVDNFKEDEEDSMEWLKNWELDSILSQKSANATKLGAGAHVTGGEMQCKICDDVFETKRLLHQHKRLEHFPSWEGGNKAFCYVPYFVEPKRFHLLRGTLSKGQSECKLCEKWLCGGVKQKVGTYLEGLRDKIKEKALERHVDNETSDNHNTFTGTWKKRGRKCKSMSRRVCELCSKILSNRKGLERHMLIHTGEKPFPCDICGKPFRRKDNCVRHKKTAHLFKKPRKPRRRKMINFEDANANITSKRSSFWSSASKN